jgi:hypothetical protein
MTDCQAADEEYIRQRLSDPWWRLSNLYYIENEWGKKVKFKLRPLQEHFLRNVWYWNDVLKARQLGFTTVIDIFILDRTLFNKNKKSGIIAHTKDDAEEIFRTKVKFPYDNLPAWLKQEIVADSSKAQRLVFNNGSSIRVGTSMRSGTIQYLHVSEYAKICAKFPEKAKEVRTGSFPSVHEGSFCFIESTAEGVGGDFHSRCMKSMAKGDKPLGKKEARFHFYPWWMDPKNSSKAPAHWAPSPELARYFKEMAAATGQTFTIDQKYWYSCTEEDLGEEMKQEHPTIPQEAFLSSGRPVFRPAHLTMALDECWTPDKRYELTPNKLKPDVEGMLLVWELPKTGMRYALGSDVAEGLEHGDNSTIDVCDEKGNQVAHWCGHVEPDELGEMIFKLGNFYRKALVGVERNNHGLTTLTKLKDLGYRNLYIQEEPERRKGEKPTKKMGWLTTTRTKPLMIDELKPLLRDNESGIRNRDHISEMQTYVVDDNGATNAQSGCKDDRVMSYAICQQMVKRIPPRRTVTETPYRPLDKTTGY